MKKKLLLTLLLALALLLGLSASAFAEARLDYVTDEAGILSETERTELNARAGRISEQYQCGVYVVIVNDYRSYVNGSIETFAEEVFAGYDLGYGDSRDGVMLAMSMADRDYDLYAHGSFGNYAFTDYGKAQLAESFLDNFRRSDWAGGFRDFVDMGETLIRRAKDGDPLDQWIPDPVEEQGPSLTPGKVLVSAVISALFGGATVGGMKKQMKTAVKQTRAANYVSQGGVTLRIRDDRFVNRTVTRQVIRHDPPSGGSRPSGGHFGGTTISGSHGGSHHSGKF